MPDNPSPESANSDLERQELLLRIEHLKRQVNDLATPLWKRPAVWIPFLGLLVAIAGLIFQVAQSRKAEHAAQATAAEKTTAVDGLLTSLKAKEQRLDNLQKNLEKVLESARQGEAAQAAQRALDTQLANEAQANIRWVITGDRGARATYERAKAQTGNKFAAVLAAQGHNPNAQDVIRRYGEQRTVQYVNQLGG